MSSRVRGAGAAAGSPARAVPIALGCRRDPRARPLRLCEPRCDRCPVSGHCAWLAAGRPAAAHAPRPAQPWAGTDRQSRGRILAALRATDVTWVSGSVLLDQARVSDDVGQPARALASLVRDGLVTRQGEEYALGSDILAS